MPLKGAGTAAFAAGAAGAAAFLLAAAATGFAAGAAAAGVVVLALEDIFASVKVPWHREGTNSRACEHDAMMI